MTIDLQNGTVLLINKPLGWTSFDAVNKIKHSILKYQRLNAESQNLTTQKVRLRVGHAGTLDPLATGLLIVCVGKETKNISNYMGLEKEYTGSFFMGATRPSFDKETEIDQTFETFQITEHLLFETAKKFIGEQMQNPPIFSAIKKDGKKSYIAARKGEDLKLAARKIQIHNFEITKIEMPLVFFKIVCSKGTYIRSIANDFGKALNCGAYLDSLCRTKIGDFKLNDALEVEEFEKKIPLIIKPQL